MEFPLNELGLTETEYIVYGVLLKAERSLASEVIKRVQLHRATVYDVLDRLMEKGLVNYIIQNKKRYYQAASPEKFLDILKEKKQEFEQKEKTTKKIVENLLKIKKSETKKQIAQIYQGKKGFKTLMQDIITTGGDFFVLGGEVQFKAIFPIYTKHWAKEREKRNIHAKILTTKAKESKWSFNKVKQIPEEYNVPTPVLIYGDKVATIIYEEEPMTVILIESKAVADSYRNHFNLIWNLAN